MEWFKQDSDRKGQAFRVAGDGWIADWWWDVVPNRPRVRIRGDPHAARIAISEMIGPDQDMMRAIDEEIARLGEMVWQPGIPGQKKSKVKTVKEADEHDVPKGRLHFGDKIDIRPVRRAKRRQI
jgi:hypothetical protein